MARPLGIEYAGAFYHGTSRAGKRGHAFFAERQRARRFS